MAWSTKSSEGVMATGPAYSLGPDPTTVKEHHGTGSGHGPIPVGTPHTGSSKGEPHHYEPSTGFQVGPNPFSDGGPVQREHYAPATEEMPDDRGGVHEFHEASHGKHDFAKGLPSQLTQVLITGFENLNAVAYHQMKLLISDYRTGGNRLTDEAAAHIAETRFSEDSAEAQHAERNLRLGEDTELMTRDATEAPLRTGSLLTGEWSVPQMAGIGVALLALNSLVAYL
jgi:hypothetical protein